MRIAASLLALLVGLAQAQLRPQLQEAEAAQMQVRDYLGDWVPEPLVDLARQSADMVVARDGSGTHRSLQAALDDLPVKAVGGRRRYIRVKAGVYRESLCVKDRVAFTLYGEPGEAQAVRITAAHYSAEPKRAGAESANPCQPNLEASSYGTAGSATVALFGDDIQLAYLTIANEAMDGVRAGDGYPVGAGEAGGAQAVALMTRGDRLHLEHVRLLGHQDTFYASAPLASSGRIYVTRSLVAGDVDFIFGNAVLVMEDCELRSRAGRRSPGEGGIVLAPSTAAEQTYGFLLVHSRFTAEPGLSPGSVAIGRAWDQGVAKGAWQADHSPNGQALVRESFIAAHIGPWLASTSRRPFSATGKGANRLFEYRNQTMP